MLTRTSAISDQPALAHHAGSQRGGTKYRSWLPLSATIAAMSLSSFCCLDAIYLSWAYFFSAASCALDFFGVGSFCSAFVLPFLRTGRRPRFFVFGEVSSDKMTEYTERSTRSTASPTCPRPRAARPARIFARRGAHLDGRIDGHRLRCPHGLRRWRAGAR